MIVKKIIEEEFTDYKVPHMFIATSRCTFKCDVLNGCKVCQNAELAKTPNIKVSANKVIQKYLSNNLTHAVVFGGLEPFDTFEDVYYFIALLRVKYHCNDTVVIYTGYNKEEIQDKIEILQKHPNIIIKFGRFIMNQKPHRDKLLGVDLASDNQYAEQIS